MRLLSRADALSWRSTTGYSALLADTLGQAFDQTARPDTSPEEYLAACALLAPWLNVRVADQQRVRVCYLFARACEAGREYGPAVRWVDEAVVAATHAHTWGEVVELLATRGWLQRASARYQEAAQDLNSSLALLFVHAEREEDIDPTFRLDLLARLATYEFFLAHYRSAMRLVREARALIPQAPNLPLAAASALWVEAHLERTRGRPERALLLAMTAADIHAREASLSSQDRIETFVAEVALDMAERAPGDAAANRNPFLTMASTHLRNAERLAREADDRPGAGLAKLARAREGRLRGRNDDRLATIERVIRSARRMGDVALEAQAITRLGEDFEAAGEDERARNCWREALTVLEGSEVPALKHVPRRKLLLASEFDLIPYHDLDR